MSLVLKLYLQGLVIAALLMLILVALYLFTYLVRNQEKPWVERRNRIFDAILVYILATPILSFAFLGILVILQARAM